MSYIDMNQPWSYMYSPSRAPLPPPTPPDYSVYLFLTGLSLCCCVGFSPVAVSRGFSSCDTPASHRGASSVSEHGLQDTHTSVTAACELRSDSSGAPEHRLHSCGAWASLPRGLWDLPRPEIQPVSLHWQVDCLPLSQPGKRPHILLEHTFKTS